MVWTPHTHTHTTLRREAECSTHCTTKPIPSVVSGASVTTLCCSQEPQTPAQETTRSFSSKLEGGPSGIPREAKLSPIQGVGRAGQRVFRLGGNRGAGWWEAHCPSWAQAEPRGLVIRVQLARWPLPRCLGLQRCPLSSEEDLNYVGGF